GVVNLTDVSIGPGLIYARYPVKSLAELRKLKLWTLDIDQFRTGLLEGLGLDVVPATFESSNKLFEEGKVDGFLGPPTAA
ncbi:hypothetical protein ACQ7B2_06715, partial [Escherichia coli]